MNTIDSSSLSLSGVIKNNEGMSGAVLKRAPDSENGRNLPSIKIQFENPPDSLIRKISSANHSEAVLMKRIEMERLLRMSFPVPERHYPPHFSVEKGSLMDVFA